MFRSVCGMMEGYAARPLASKAAMPSPSSSREVQAALPSATEGMRLGSRMVVEEGYQLRKSGKPSE